MNRIQTLAPAKTFPATGAVVPVEEGVELVEVGVVELLLLEERVLELELEEELEALPGLWSKQNSE